MWYKYRQNNSGGIFLEPAINVIVEADSDGEAQGKAEEVGVYFDPFSDCQCCGPRWDDWADTYDTKEKAIDSVYPHDAEWAEIDGVKTLVVVK